MSRLTRVTRTLALMRHLQEQGAARFEELVSLLNPISRTTLSGLLAELVREGELEQRGRLYLPAQGNLLAAGTNIYRFPEGLKARTFPLLDELSQQTGHACALFARVGVMTMKIMDQAASPDADWRFSSTGYEWPLVPFHGFAQLFLAYATPEHARLSYQRWSRHLRPGLCEDSWTAFAGKLRTIRRRGYALEYQEELPVLLRLVVPLHRREGKPVCFALGLVARSVYLLELKRYLPLLRTTSAKLEEALEGRVPAFRFDFEEPQRG